MSAAPTATADALLPLQDIVDAVTERAPRVDGAETDVRPALRELGRAGLLTLGVPGRAGTLADQAGVVRALARSCMATAFATWAQRMAIEYLAGWGADALRAEVLGELAAGSRPGATAMATAFQDALGLREVAVEARADGGGVVLDGVVPWASNLFPDGAVVVLPARATDGRRLIVALRTDQPGVQLSKHPELLALGATASTSLRLESVRIPGAWVLTDRFLDFLANIRAPFLLLQTSFCLGLADAALDSADGRFQGATAVLEPDHRELTQRRDAVAAEQRRLLEGDGHAGEALVRLRLDAGRLGVDAVRHESGVRGGAGYLAASPTARRLREAAFLPIQSPTEAQLRWELSRSA